MIHDEALPLVRRAVAICRSNLKAHGVTEPYPGYRDEIRACLACFCRSDARMMCDRFLQRWRERPS